ncbi:hypothetical protein BC567DRAFT_222592 [Phyllosticta citribraziliensis]
MASTAHKAAACGMFRRARIWSAWLHHSCAGWQPNSTASMPMSPLALTLRLAGMGMVVKRPSPAVAGPKGARAPRLPPLKLWLQPFSLPGNGIQDYHQNSFDDYSDPREKKKRRRYGTNCLAFQEHDMVGGGKFFLSVLWCTSNIGWIWCVW